MRFLALTGKNVLHPAIRSHGEPAEVTTDRAHTLVRTVAELLPAALHDTTQYANNRVEADHGRLKARLRPMRCLKRDRTASVVIRGHAFIQKPAARPLRTRGRCTSQAQPGRSL
jgi:transposase-like protein